MTDKADLTSSINELAKSRKKKESILAAAVKTVSENRRKLRKQQNRST